MTLCPEAGVGPEHSTVPFVSWHCQSDGLTWTGCPNVIPCGGWSTMRDVAGPAQPAGPVFDSVTVTMIAVVPGCCRICFVSWYWHGVGVGVGNGVGVGVGIGVGVGVGTGRGVGVGVIVSCAHSWLFWEFMSPKSVTRAQLTIGTLADGVARSWATKLNTAL